MTDGPILEVAGVTRIFRRGADELRAVDDVSLTVGYGETIGVIGESGSGKSTLARLILGLQPCDAGRVMFDGQHVESLSPKARQAMRSSMTAVFQEPQESLNPRMRAGDIVGEPLSIHRPQMTRRERRERVLETLALVALPAGLYDRYPRQLSGGQQQRLNIARAVVTEPSLIVLDEPTSALDLSVQAQILRLLESLQERLRLSYLFISHDVDCIAYMSQRVVVMYHGRVLESGPAADVMEHPRHPYTIDLLASALGLGRPSERPAAQSEESYASARQLREVAPNHWVAESEPLRSTPVTQTPSPRLAAP